MVIRAHFRGMRVEELPVVWVCRRDGRFGGTKQFAILPWVMRLRAELRRRHGVVVIGIRDPRSGHVDLNPGDATAVAPGLEVVYLARRDVLSDARR